MKLLIFILIVFSHLTQVEPKIRKTKLAAWDRCKKGQYVNEVKVEYDEKDRRLDIGCTHFDDCHTFKNCSLSKRCRESRLWDHDDGEENNIYVAGIAPGNHPDSIKLYCCPMYLNRITNCTKRRVTLYKRLRFGIDYFRGLNSTNHTIRDLTIKRKRGQIKGIPLYKVEAEICNYENDTYGWCPGQGRDGDRRKNSDKKKKDNDKGEDKNKNKNERKNKNEDKNKNKNNDDNNKNNRDNDKNNKDNNKNSQNNNQNNPDGNENTDPDMQKNMDRKQYEEEYAKRKTAGALAGANGQGNMIPQSQWIDIDPGTALAGIAAGAAVPAPLAIGLACLGCQQFPFDNGFVTYDPNLRIVPLTGTATLACNPGWTLIGNADVKCSEPFTWDPFSSFCDIPCAKFDADPHGDTIYTEEHQNQILTKGTAELTCHEHFLATALDKGPITCTLQYCTLGEWSDELPTCEQACPNTIDVDFGTVEYPQKTTDAYGNEVTPKDGKAVVICTGGFLSNSNPTTTLIEVTCQSDGTFDEKFDCLEACEIIEPAVVYASVAYSEQIGAFVPFEGTATVTCDEGYEFYDGSTEATLTCDTANFDLTGLPNPQKCIQACEEYDTDELANVIFPLGYSTTKLDSGKYVIDTVVTATCKPGYLVYNGKEWTTTTEAKCFSPDWSETLLSCEPGILVVCSEITSTFLEACQHDTVVAPDTAVYALSTKDSEPKDVTPPGGTAELACPADYLPNPVTTTTLTCLDGGTWSGTFQCLPACDISSVSHDATIFSIIYSKNINDLLVPQSGTATVTCAEGYEFESGSIQVKITCGTNNDHEFDSSLVTSCIKACSAYSSRPAQIKRLSYSPTATPGLLPSEKYKEGTEVEAECTDNHYAYFKNQWTTETTAECSSPNWDATLPDCVIGCSKASLIAITIANGDYGDYTEDDGDYVKPTGTAEITCDTGFVLDETTGPSTAKCIDGGWVFEYDASEMHASCIKVCPKLTGLDSASVTYGAKDVFDVGNVYAGATATLQCTGTTDTVTDGTNYRYIGDNNPQTTTFTCGTDGQWDEFEPTGCINTCPKHVTLVPPSATVTYNQNTLISRALVGEDGEITCKSNKYGIFTCTDTGWSFALANPNQRSLHVNSAFYRITIPEFANFGAAHEHCTILCSQLATIENDAAFTTITNGITSLNTMYKNYYIGMERLPYSGKGAAAEDKLKWFDGTAFKYTLAHWLNTPQAIGLNPNCNGCQNDCSCHLCMSIHTGFVISDGLIGFNDFECDKTGGAICQIKIEET